MTPAAATRLVITQQPPSTVKVSTRFSMQASIEDAYGNVVTTASGTVSVAFANNPTGATLGGTMTVTTSGGVASFTNLTINKTGSGYTLRVSSSGLASATSNPINVTKTGNAPTTLFAPAGGLATDLSLAPAGARQPGPPGRLEIQEAVKVGLIAPQLPDVTVDRRGIPSRESVAYAAESIGHRISQPAGLRPSGRSVFAR